MATCEGLRQIFENPPLPENPSLIDSLTTWNHVKPNKDELPSFSEIFGELHFKETLESSSLPFITSFQSPSASQSLLNLYPKPIERTSSKLKHGFSSMNLVSLYTCTEGLGFESFEDVDDGSSIMEELKNGKNLGIMRRSSSSSSFSESRKSRTFPPPIPSIGRNGKPWKSYKSFRCDGRLVLKEIMMPTHGQEFMHACREDGRLTLHLVHRDQETQKDEEKQDDCGGGVEEERGDEILAVT